MEIEQSIFCFLGLIRRILGCTTVKRRDEKYLDPRQTKDHFSFEPLTSELDASFIVDALLIC